MSYTKIESRFIEEINSNVTVYSHDKTKARIMTIENDDPNKVFSVAFRTPPINDCGLTHILEHSVLCGSKKYPLKDPFVELLKGSLNTFLNAFTFPDKTMYPCASLNDKDFNNLMSVYLDAVFYPNIYTNPYIFKQEGWHYELDDLESPITINGVVYNEMKGAFSDPLGVMGRYVMHSLFKDTCYGLESGGDPKEIPNLSYEDFKMFHSKYYSPSNSYILLYGDCDMNEKMKFIEDEYLNKFDYVEFDTSIKSSSINEMVREEYQYNVTSLDQNQDYLAYNIALGDNLDIKKMTALSLICEDLFTKPGAPIKEALIKEGLAEDIDVTFEMGIKDAFLSIVAINSDKNKLDRFLEIIDDGFKNAKLDKEELSAALSYKEFKVREGKSDGPKGLNFILKAMDSWLYDDNMAFAALEVLKYYKELKDDLNTNYFYDLINESFVNNKHKSIVTLIPSLSVSNEEDERLSTKLELYKKSLSKDELLDLINETKALKEYQEAPDSADAIATLPRLSIEDLSDEPIKTNISKLDRKYPLYHSSYFTNGILYMDYLFDVSDFDASMLQYAKFLCHIYDLVNTKKYTYAQINKLEHLYTGGFTTNVKSIDTLDGKHKVYIDLKISSLSENTLNALDIVCETIFNSIFDRERVLELLKETKAGLEQSLAYSGHTTAAYRAASYASLPYYYGDMISGIGYLDFITDIINRYEDDGDAFITKLYEIESLIFTKKRYVLDVTCDNNILDSAINASDMLYEKLDDNSLEFVQEFTPNALNEAIITSADVNYVAKYVDLDRVATGYLNVLKNAISLDYLWQNVRVLGGAYGCMINFGELGSLMLTSYRDPSTTRTYDIYNNLHNFIKELNPTDEEMLKYKIGAMGALDDSYHVSSLGVMAFNEYISGFNYEYKKKKRREIIGATIDDLHKYADIICDAMKEDFRCALVSAKGYSESKDLFVNSRDLVKK